MKAFKAALAASLFFGGAFAMAGQALAEWPERAVTVIVPWAAGGGTDATARAVAQELEERFGQPFNVVNRTGGGGLVGHITIANSAPDGYTLGVITIETTMFEAQGLPGAAPENFTLLGRFNADAIGINVRADASYENAQDLIDAVQTNPGQLKASGANQGGLSHLAWAGLLNRLEIDPQAGPWVASDGSAPAMQQLAANAIAIVSTSPAEAQSLVDAGEAKTLMLMADERSSLYPDIPTVEEALGVDWSPLPFRGVAGPAGLPEEVVTKVSEALAEITQDEEFIAMMESRGFSVAYQDAETFTQTVMRSRDDLVSAMQAVGLAQ